MHMSELTEQRRRAIADLIRSDSLASQDELAERLTALGFAVTQATISRDLDQLGAVKVRRGGRAGYALPDQLGGSAGPPLAAGQRLAAVLRDWVRSIDLAANLVVIKTPPGSAHLVGVALDHSDLTEIVGTICGDDTIFAACAGAAEARELASKLRALPAGHVQ
jgi:transcriptional regulator of arginine metabolism